MGSETTTWDASKTYQKLASEDQQRIVDQTGAEDRVEAELRGEYRR